MGFKVVRLVDWQMNDGTEFGSEYDQGPLAWLIEFSHYASIGKFLVFEASPPKIKPSPYKKTLKNANDSFQPLEKKPLPLSSPYPPPNHIHFQFPPPLFLSTSRIVHSQSSSRLLPFGRGFWAALAGF